MAGTAALCPEFHFLQDGLELADSYCFNPHKWMFTNFDCDCFFVADRAQSDPHAVDPAGVPPQPGDGIGRRDRLSRLASSAGPPISRLETLVRHSLVRRRRASGAHPRAREAGSRVCRLGAGRPAIRAGRAGRRSASSASAIAAATQPTSSILDALNASGKLLLSHTRLDDKLTLRFSIGQTNTQRRHVEHAWQAIRDAADLLG